MVNQHARPFCVRLIEGRSRSHSPEGNDICFASIKIFAHTRYYDAEGPQKITFLSIINASVKKVMIY